MKNVILSAIFTMFLVSNVYAEAWIPDYGYYESPNEISAKSELISETNPDNIFDFDTSPNAGGESIVDGKYYVPIMYNGGYNGTDTDYLYLDELHGEKGDKGDKGNTGNTGATGSQGIQGNTGSQGVAGTNGVDGKDGAIGPQGVKGDKGDTGASGLNGISAQALQPKMEDRQELMLEGRILDTKRTTWSVYGGHDFGNDVDIVGAKLTVKLNRGYYEKKVDSLEEQVLLMQIAQERSLRDEKMDEAMNLLDVEKNNNITLTKTGYQITSKF